MATKPLPPPTPDDFKRVAESIRKVSDAGRALNKSGLSRRAVIVLLHDATNVPMKDIKIILDATESLASWCLTRSTDKRASE